MTLLLTSIAHRCSLQFRKYFTALALAVLMMLFGCSKAETESGTPQAEASQTIDHSYSRYARVLKGYVGDGRVDYAGLKADRALLDSVVQSVADADLATATENQRLAFYINAYNVLTLRSVVDAYPVKSIRDIDDAWKKKWRVAGAQLSLDQLENEILRKEFAEPRIHVAINCASISCPPLMPAPFIAEGLERQLEDASRNFASSDQYNRLIPIEGKARLSKVFEWFGEDFIARYFDTDKFSALPEAQNAALNFLIQHLPEEERSQLANSAYEVSFIEYDWGLNDAANGSD